MHLRPDDRLLVVAPHPDDEALAAGGLIARAKRAGLPVRVVFLTLGDGWIPALSMHPEYAAGAKVEPEDMLAFGRLRAAEVRKAAQQLGLSPEDVTLLGYPDQALAAMWERGWETPVSGPATKRTEVPYAVARRPGAKHAGAELAADLAEIVGETKPTKVVLPHPSDAHSDHRAAAAFVHHALFAAENRAKTYAYVVHEPALAPDERLPEEGRGESALPARTAIELDAEELVRKREAIEAHRSQVRRMGERMRRHAAPFERFVVLPTAQVRGERSAVIAGDQLVPDVDAMVSREALTMWIHLSFEGDGALELARPMRGDPRKRWCGRVTLGASGFDSTDGVVGEREGSWVRLSLPNRPAFSGGVLVAGVCGAQHTGWWPIRVAQSRSEDNA